VTPTRVARVRRALRSAPPLSRLVVVSVIVLVALVGARRLGPGSQAPFVGPAPNTVNAKVTSFTNTRPAINGSTRPPLVPAAERAVERLAATSRPSADGHAHSSGHVFGRAPEATLSPAEADRFAQQWAAAKAAIPNLDTTAKAAAAGYVLSSLSAPGVGVHWVNWQLIARPFDPARPAMLLFTNKQGIDHLVGFSYWVQGAHPPAGFAGTNDRWHTHAGLCVVNGWVEREEVPAPADCPGSWLAGGDLWMLHAWVVDRYSNRWGLFAQANPKLCPTGPVPDIASCTPDRG